MIEKIDIGLHTAVSLIHGYPQSPVKAVKVFPDAEQICNKINEIIDAVNELNNINKERKNAKEVRSE